MRLINAWTWKLEEFDNTATTPPYAILSHTWGEPEKGEGEVTFEDMKNELWKTDPKKRYGANKIKKTCQLADDEFGLSYAWVDTCCIDKSSSAELTEAINSMFKWYQKAAVCIAYLADWGRNENSFTHCRWFTRGWTLQELIAPSEVHFFDQDWHFRGVKREIGEALHNVTKIDEDVLKGVVPVQDIPVAVRMSWAAFRQTKREEDMAYCLLGIFDTHMPMLYGEGQKAFLRLQEQIIQDNADMSIFAWKALPENRQYYTGIFASSPREF
ncbi:HET-domain-containing protein, partial [Periconia macrospinosa]